MKALKLILTFICRYVFCCCSSIKKFEASGMSLSHEKAKEMYDAYNTSLKTLIKDNRNQLMVAANKSPDPEFLPTEYVWISKKRLKLYLDFLDELECKNKEEISGVSIYFARLGTAETLNYRPHEVKQEVATNRDTPPKEGDYRARKTVFFAPTIRFENAVGPEMLKHKAFSIIPKDDSEKNKYIGEFSPVKFLNELGGDSSENDDEKPGSPPMPDSDTSGDEEEGTPVFGNDTNLMPPMTSPGSAIVTGTGTGSSTSVGTSSGRKTYN